MRSVLSLLVVFALALAFGPSTPAEADGTNAPAIGACLDASGSHGVLNLVGHGGMPFHAFTPSGTPVAGGVMPNNNHSQPVSGLDAGNAGVVVVIGGSVLFAAEEWCWG